MSFLERINNIENDIENNFKPMVLNILEDIVSKSIENLSNNEYIISELIIKKLYNVSINISIEQISNNIRLTCSQVSGIVIIEHKKKQSFDALSHVIDNIIPKILLKNIYINILQE